MTGVDNLAEFLLGAIIVSDCVAALFFVRYWRVTKDRFFVYFAWAFGLDIVSRLTLAGHLVGSEFEPLVYVVRLLSYLVIAGAIVDKNRVTLRKVIFQRSSA
jgi:hypothetical protein